MIFVCFPLFLVLTGGYLRSRSSIYDQRDSDRENGEKVEGRKFDREVGVIGIS